MPRKPKKRCSYPGCTELIEDASYCKKHRRDVNRYYEKYMGDALLQKTFTIDFLNKTRVKNDGIVPQYYVQDSHKAIIPKNIFMKVQEELSMKDQYLEKAII